MSSQRRYHNSSARCVHAQEEFEAGDEAIKAVDAREKREAERRAAGEVDEEEDDDAADAAQLRSPHRRSPARRTRH